MARGRPIRPVETLPITCPYCGETIEVDVERVNGSSQQFVEDCVTCCRPIYCRFRVGRDGELLCETSTEDEE